MKISRQRILQFIRNFFDRSEWAIFILRLDKPKDATVRAGLILVQIDGFSLTQFEKALSLGLMPFLKSLRNKDAYQTYPFYAGLPSVTPAVQGEIFYGVKSSVPAFSFFDRKHKRIIKMYDSQASESVEEILRQKGRGLLEGGSSYSNIYRGGARESHYCAADWGVGSFFRAFNPFIFPILFLLYIDVFVRTFAFLVFEFVLALVGFCKGAIKGWELKKEFEFILVRIVVCILLRELVVAGAKIDIRRGLPIIHLNLIGYDEQSHRRGPASNYAHWTLPGIDYAVKRLYQKAAQAPRLYETWVYSDHGQNQTVPYPTLRGEKLEATVKRLFGEKNLISADTQTGTMRWTEDWMAGRISLNAKNKERLKRNVVRPDELVVTAMGPEGHIYFPNPVGVEELNRYAEILIKEAGIPLVMAPVGEDQAYAWTRRGKFILPEQIAEVIGADHPFLQEIKVDLIRVNHHPDAGDLLVGGWAIGEQAITFPTENGSHGGMDPEEMTGFVFLARNAPVVPGKTYLRPTDLRETVFRKNHPEENQAQRNTEKFSGDPKV